MTLPSTSSPSDDVSVNKRPHVVVVGAGFAGINATHALRNADVDVTLVDKNNFHTFQPLLYQVSTGYLPAEEVGTAIRSVFRHQKNAHLRVGRVIGADLAKNELQLAGHHTLNYDYLLITAGARANFFGIPGMEEHSWPLYTLDDAIRLRTHLLAELERSAIAPGTHPERSTVVVVGGGPTGVEMAGALSSMAQTFIGDHINLRVILVEATPRLLNGFSEKSGKFAVEDLRKRGVEVRLGEAVASADAEGVVMKSGERIETHTVVWAAGVAASGIGEMLGLETGRAGRIVVEPDLRAKGHDNIFVAGDVSITPDPLPQVAPAAIQGGDHAGKQIARLVSGKSTKPFVYKDKGIMAVLGRGDAVAELPFFARKAGAQEKHPIRLAGLLAWFLWLFVHIISLIGFRNKIKVLVDWAWNYFTSRRAGAILIHVPEQPMQRDIQTDDE